ncbi:uncharacterized protein METZ01_LOCUS499584 [marine metagenome]|uniref:Uncharacterized protein n=1 Tax=marine metagenome TaxID=408172 RepID=A0A383DR55_9ZZZZ
MLPVNALTVTKLCGHQVITVIIALKKLIGEKFPQMAQ